MLKEEFTPDDVLKEAFDTTTRGVDRLETRVCRFLCSRGECNHVGDEEGLRGCIAFLLGRLVRKLERY